MTSYSRCDALPTSQDCATTGTNTGHPRKCKARLELPQDGSRHYEAVSTNLDYAFYHRRQVQPACLLRDSLPKRNLSQLLLCDYVAVLLLIRPAVPSLCTAATAEAH